MSVGLDAKGGKLGQVFFDLRRVLSTFFTLLAYGLVPGLGFIGRWRLPGATRANRLRLAIERLGLTYVKLGQFLAMRYDIFPQEVCAELESLFERVTPMSPQEVKAVIAAEIHVALSSSLAEFDEVPIAAGSVAQVHRALTRAGDEVVIKVQRPGLEPIFRADIRNLLRFATVIDKLGLAGKLSARAMTREFARWTLRELDFRQEGQTAERVAANALPFEKVPKIYWDLTTPRLLTMEYIKGMSLGDLADRLSRGATDEVARRIPGFRLEETLEHLADASLNQLFTAGFFHGDPHPGNILICGGNQVAFVDFGIFGSLYEAQLTAITAMIENLAVGNVRTSFRHYTKQLIPTEDSDFRTFAAECFEILTRWWHSAGDPTLPVKDRHLARFTGEMINASRRHGMRFGLSYLLFWRTLNLLNASLWRLAPEYDLLAKLRRFFEATRPDPLTRKRDIIDSTAWQAELSRAAQQLSQTTRSALDNGSVALAELNVECSDETQLARSHALERRRLAGALAVLSAAIASTHLDGWSSRGAVVVFLLGPLYLAVRGR